MRPDASDMPWLPFQPNIVNNVAKAYSDSTERMKKSAAGGSTQDVTNLEEGSTIP